ncbi:MAG: carbonic anhydrase [Proteobacteria bacterium]|nr:carbonic anhydrase [Pseudomonadota bacterium]
MKNSFKKILQGYAEFRDKYVHGDTSIMHYLSHHGQKPDIMVVACCDSRVDPALILQCEPGDLFVTRNVANIVPPYEKDEAHHGTSAALEFAIRFLQVKHLVLLGHSQCGGIQALLEGSDSNNNDFITSWVSVIKTEHCNPQSVDDCAKVALNQSYQNCLTFPWIKERVLQNKLKIHLWFFDIKTGQIFTYCETEKKYQPLESSETE